MSATAKLIVRSSEGLSLYHGLVPPAPGPGLNNLPAGAVEASADGSLLAVLAQDGVAVYATETESLVAELPGPLPGLLAAAFSPCGSYVQTYQRPAQGAGNAEKNLKLWNWRKGEVVLQVFQKSFSRDDWPAIQITNDGQLACQAVNGAINCYSLTNPAAGVVKRLTLKNVGGFALSPQAEGPQLLAAFVPEARGSPGFMAVWDVGAIGKGDNPPHLARRSFFRANSVKFLWNAAGTAVLGLAISDEDKSGQSYYGEQHLHFLAADGSNDCLVPLPEGNVQDVAWNRRGTCFCVVAGHMPAKVQLFNQRCKLVADLGSGSFNIVRWSPQGTYLALAGFGNLPGDISFWHRKQDGRCDQLGKTRADLAVTCQWAPDGQHLITSTTAPRMRVDNAFHIYNYWGELLHEQRFGMLLEATWLAALEGAFPDQPPKPRSASGSSQPAANGTAGRPAKPFQAAAGYVPPHVRGASGAGSSVPLAAAQERHERVGKFGPGHVRGLPPGAEALQAETSTGSKNARRRRSKKKGGDATDADAVDAEETHQPSSATEADQGVARAPLIASSEAANGAEPADAAKRGRNLQKKLRQIQQLKERQGQGGLDAEQQQKLAGEQAIIDELRSLGLQP